MRTIGVDLASQPRKTGLAVVEWADGRAALQRVVVGADDGEIVDEAERSDAVGIDAPFGWPSEFVRFVNGRGQGAAWTDERRDQLRFRATDVAARERLGRPPLSVAADRIALAAMRCSGLLHRLRVEDRSGEGHVFEVYPAVALRQWGLPSRGYKGSKRVAARRSLWAALLDAAPWLSVTDEDRVLVGESDDALDAVVSALVARAATRGAIEPIPEEHRVDARAEGWIMIPRAGTLASLAESGR